MVDQQQHLAVVLDDIPPSLNNAYRTVIIDGVPHRVLTTAAKRWKLATAKQIKVAAGRVGWSMVKKTPMKITIHYRAPNILVWDLDGKAKLLVDAAMEALGLDDRYVMDLHLTKERQPREQVLMRIEEWRSA